MELQQLSVSLRESSGTALARRARLRGFVPAVIYGEGKEPVHIEISAWTLSNLLQGKLGEHALVQVDVTENPELNGPAMIKAVQHHPVKGDVLHADFLRIRLDEKIHTFVPVRLEGQAKGVVEGGLLDHQRREIEVECLALDVPEFFLVNVSELEIGDSVHVSDLELVEGVKILTETSRVVVAVHAPRVVEEEVAEELAEGELAEGEEAPAEGDESASDDDSGSEDGAKGRDKSSGRK